ncbi:MAG TPA: 30S ribosome-binding factor RbfA [Cytophagaceae bacterium]
MESKRQQKFSRLIQKELSELFQRDAKSMFQGTFITVTTVRMSPDLSVAKVYLSFLMAKDKKEVLEKIKAESKVIRKMLGEKIRNQVRIIPELIFYIDDNVDYAARIDQIFSQIEIPPKEEEGEEDNEK